MPNYALDNITKTFYQTYLSKIKSCTYRTSQVFSPNTLAISNRDKINVSLTSLMTY